MIQTCVLPLVALNAFIFVLFVQVESVPTSIPIQFSRTYFGRYRPADLGTFIKSQVTPVSDSEVKVHEPDLVGAFMDHKPETIQDLEVTQPESGEDLGYTELDFIDKQEDTNLDSAGRSEGASENFSEKLEGLPEPYDFGYEFGDSSGRLQRHRESADGTGRVIGSYGFIDQFGMYREVEYIADANGFRVKIRSNEPGLSNQSSADAKFIVESPPEAVVAQMRSQRNQILLSDVSTSSEEEDIL